MFSCKAIPLSYPCVLSYRRKLTLRVCGCVCVCVCVCECETEALAAAVRLGGSRGEVLPLSPVPRCSPHTKFLSHYPPCPTERLLAPERERERWRERWRERERGREVEREREIERGGEGEDGNERVNV